MGCTGYGKTPIESYKNTIVMTSILYEANLKQYVLSKNYPNLQVESPLKIIITYLDEEKVSPLPVPPTSEFEITNSSKTTIVVRNLDNSTSQYTDKSTSTTSCIFEAYYYALDSCNLNDNLNISSLYINTYITSVIV